MMVLIKMQANEYQRLTSETEIYTPAAKKFLEQAFLSEKMGAMESLAVANQTSERLELWLKLAYCTGKLNGEAGEVAELIFKALRDGSGNPGEIDEDRRIFLFKELGDVMWYVARLSDLLGFKLEDVMQANINKLMDRKDRGVLSGSGDDR